MGGKGETPTRSSAAASRGRVARLPCHGRTVRPLELAPPRAPTSVAASSRLARSPLAILTPAQQALQAGYQAKRGSAGTVLGLCGGKTPREGRSAILRRA